MNHSLASEPDSLGSTSTTLLSRAKAADPDAWRRLSLLYGPVVYRWARQAGIQTQDAADIMQDVFHSLTIRIGGFNERDSASTFRGWLWVITRNKVRDHFRRIKNKVRATGGSHALEQIQQLPALPPDPHSESGLVETSRLRQRALELVRSDFEDRTWRIFWRAAVEGDATADIAADLGVTVWAVYKAKSRVLRRLREELEGLLD